MAKSSKIMDLSVSKFLFQILLDSTLEFQDLVRNSQSENFLYKTRIDIIESFEDFNTQSAIVANINNSFSWLFK